MIAIHELTQPLDLFTPLGDAWAIIMIDYGAELNSCFLCHIKATGELKFMETNQVRMRYNHAFFCQQKIKGGDYAMSFKSVQKKIEKEGFSKKSAGAILANSTRHASPTAKRANPKLKRVK